MKPVLMLAAGAAALSLAACDRNGAPLFGPAAALKPVSRLNCPQEQGMLKRTGASPDGQTCTYSDGDGTDVALQIVRTSGQDPRQALKPLEASLETVAAQPGSNEPAESDEEVGTPQPTHPADEKSRAAVEAAADQANQDAAVDGRENDHVDKDADDHPGHHHGDKDDHVSVDMPGVHVKADGDKADVNVFGMQIKADGDHGSVTHKPRSGFGRSLSIEGDDSGAVIRTDHVGRANYRSTVMWLQDDKEGRAYASVGYVAAGPNTGPLVVATVKIRGDRKHGVYDNAAKLVRRASRS